MDVGLGKTILYTLRDVSPTSTILTREEAFFSKKNLLTDSNQEDTSLSY